MNPPHRDTAAEMASPRDGAGEAEPTGLPWLRTWRGVYAFVFGSFVLWVVLLFVLTRIFS